MPQPAGRDLVGRGGRGVDATSAHAPARRSPRVGDHARAARARRTQLARYALPQAVAGQSIALGAGLPSVRLSLGGELPSPPGTKVTAERLQIFGRAALRTLDALDGPLPAGGPTRDLAVARKILPGWAVRLLVAALLLPATLMVGDAVARLRRRGGPLTGAVCLGARPRAAVRRRRPAGPRAGADRRDRRPRSGAAAGRGAARRRARGRRWAAARRCWRSSRCCCARGWRAAAPRRAGSAHLALLLVTCALAWVAWFGNPYAALLLVLPANLWLLLADGVRPRRWLSVALTLTSLVPVGVVIGMYAGTLSMSAGEIPWFWMLAVAGGAVSVPAALLWSVGAGVATAALLLALRPAMSGGERAVTVRGPLSYAGPGSLGGTEFGDAVAQRSSRGGRRLPPRPIRSWPDVAARRPRTSAERGCATSPRLPIGALTARTAATRATDRPPCVRRRNLRP